MDVEQKSVEYLVVDTTAFIQNAPLQEVADNIVTCQEVINEITSKRQLRRLAVLAYDLTVKDVFPESVQAVTDFAKKTGDYPSLSATDIKVMALTYQLEKEKVGVEHIKSEPVKKSLVLKNPVTDMKPDITGFFLPGQKKDEKTNESEKYEETSDENEAQEQERNQEEDQTREEHLAETFENPNVKVEESEADNVLVSTKDGDEEVSEQESEGEEEEESEDYDEDNDSGWITPANVKLAKKQVHSGLMEEKHVKVACMTTDFAMQNVLKQMNLNISALDGRMIKQLRTFILRCYTCFKTTSIMDKQFCPKCGNKTLKKVAVSLDENGKQQIHINLRKPLTARGKKYSLPRIQGGKHPNNPILVADQPIPDNRPSRLARTRNNPLDDDYIAGFSPFVMRDVNSKSALLRTGQEVKYWMRKNPNEARRRRK